MNSLISGADSIFKLAKVQKKQFTTVIAMSFCLSLSYAFMFLNYYFSRIELVVVYSLASQVYKVLFEFALLDRKPVVPCVVGVSLIAFGLFLISFIFQWPTDKADSRTQLFFLNLSPLLYSLSEVLNIKFYYIVSTTNPQFHHVLSRVTTHFFVRFFSIIPLLFLFFVFECNNAKNTPSFFDINFSTLLFFGVTILELSSFAQNTINDLNESDKQCTLNYISNFSKLYVLPVLLICSIIQPYSYTAMQFIGLTLVITGTSIFGLFNDNNVIEYAKNSDSDDTVALLGNDDSVLTQTVISDSDDHP